MVGLIYELYSTENPYQFYVGSTEVGLERRMRVHFCTAKLRPQQLVYKCLNHYDKGTWRIVLVEECDKTGVELKKLEEFWRVTLRAPLNKLRAYRTPEEANEQHRKADAKWRDKNRAYKNKRCLAKYYENHEANKKRSRDHARIWRADNPEIVRERTRKYRKKQNIFPFFRAAQARAAFQLKIST